MNMLESELFHLKLEVRKGHTATCFLLIISFATNSYLIIFEKRNLKHSIKFANSNMKTF